MGVWMCQPNVFFVIGVSRPTNICSLNVYSPQGIWNFFASRNWSNPFCGSAWCKLGYASNTKTNHSLYQAYSPGHHLLHLAWKERSDIHRHLAAFNHRHCRYQQVHKRASSFDFATQRKFTFFPLIVLWLD